MTGLGTVLLFVAIVVVLAVAGFAIALARKGKRRFDAQGTGLAPNAPREWAGAHSPEAKLHRRLTTAARTLSAQPLGDAAAIEQRVAIEQRLLRLDEQLVAVTAAPGPDTAERLTELAALVTSAERAVADHAAIDPINRDELGES